MLVFEVIEALEELWKFPAFAPLLFHGGPEYSVPVHLGLFFFFAGFSPWAEQK